MVMGIGQFGHEVAGIQQMLNEAGHYDGQIDGVNGPITRQAIRSWQRRLGIPAHGMWDEQTGAATFEKLSRFNPNPTLDSYPITPPGRSHG